MRMPMGMFRWNRKLLEKIRARLISGWSDRGPQGQKPAFWSDFNGAAESCALSKPINETGSKDFGFGVS